jgi:DNA-binding XRE family transcriptional regulator
MLIKNKKGDDAMFPNLQAEQKRYNFTNQQVADKLGLSRVAYEGKKKSGRFVASECKELCQLFQTSFEYLFSTEVINNSTA